MGITEKDFLKLVKCADTQFQKEEYLRRYLAQNLSKLILPKGSQIEEEAITTHEPGAASARADIVVRSKNESSQILVVFEVKLARSVSMFSSYDDAVKQMRNYAQDCKALYGVLISETVCKIYKYNQPFSIIKEKRINALPFIDEIEAEFIKRGEFVANKINDLKKWFFIGAILIGVIFFILSDGSKKIDCPVKGNVNLQGNKIYHLKGDKFYDSVRIKKSEGDVCFATEKEALDAGFLRALKYNPVAKLDIPVVSEFEDEMDIEYVAIVDRIPVVSKPYLAKPILSDCKVKGNVTSKGQKIYYLRGSAFYDRTKIVESEGDRCFKTEKEAVVAGFRKPFSSRSKSHVNTEIIQKSEGCPIKGNVNSSGKKIYHMFGTFFYKKTIIREDEGDACFNTEEEAIAAGFRKPKSR